MKKLLSILLCLVLVVTSCALLVGCSSDKGAATLYANNLVNEITNEGDDYIITLNGEHSVDTLILEEKTDNVNSFGVYGYDKDDKPCLIYRQNRIDKYRVCALDAMVTSKLKIEIFDKKGKVKIDNIEVYDSSASKREAPFRVTEYLMSTDQKLQNNRNNSELYEHLKVVTDLVLIGEISMDAQGNVICNEGAEDFASDMAILNEFKTKIKNPNMKIIASVDIQSNTIPADVKDKYKNKEVYKWIKKNLATISSNLTAFANQYGLDGIDLDWQYPENGTQWNWYSKLIVELGNKLKADNKILTATLRPNACSLSKKARTALEYVNLMTYDMFDERGEHSSNYETCRHSVEEFMKKSKFTADKITLGIPFYGRTTNQSIIIFEYGEYFGKKADTEIDKWVNKIYNYKYLDKDGIEKYSEVYYNGYAMIRDKVTYALASGLGGVSIFRLSYDISSKREYSLHNAVAEAIERVMAKATSTNTK